MTVLKPYLDIQFAAPVWKFAVDTHNLYAEIRDVQNRKVSFASISFATGQLNFTDFSLPETWLCGLEGGHQGVMFLHGYASAGSPAHQGITAVDGIKGGVLWQNYTHTLNHIGQYGPVAYNTQIQPRKLVLLDAHSGSVLRGYEPAIDIATDHNISFPDISDQVPIEFADHAIGERYGPVQALNYHDFKLISFHIKQNGALRQLLFITKSGNLVFNEVLNDKIQKLQPEAFMLVQNRVVYVKNKTNIVVVNL